MEIYIYRHIDIYNCIDGSVYIDIAICVNFVLCNYTLITINHNLCLLSRIDIHYTQNFRIWRLQEFVYLEIAIVTPYCIL